VTTTSASVRLLGASVGGVGVAFGFAPFESFFAVVLGLAALIASIRGATARRGALLGAVFGAVFLTILVSWLHVLGIGVLAALVLVSVPFYAAFGAVFAMVSGTRAWVLWGACLWVGTEFLRSVVPFGGFAWGRLAFTTVGTPLDSYARWLGVAALSGVVFVLGGCLVLVLARASSAPARVAGLVGAAVVVAAALLLPTGVADPGRNLQVAIVQGNVPGTGANGGWEQRQVLDNHVATTIAYAQQVNTGATPQPDVVLWPENASDIDPLTDASAGSDISAAAQAVGAPILVGAILDGPTAATAQNVGIAWDPRDGAGDRYVKRHLVPFGEYVPFRSVVTKVLPYVGREIPRDMLAGDSPGAVPIAGTVLGDMMCFDVVFDPLARDVVRGGAQLLVVQTNNATYTGTSQPEQQWQIARMRAIEAGRQIAVPSTNGISAIADADGDVVARAQSGVAQVLTEQITTGHGITWGIRAGGYLEYALTAVGVIALLAAVRRRHRKVPIPLDHAAQPAPSTGRATASA